MKFIILLSLFALVGCTRTPEWRSTTSLIIVPSSSGALTKKDVSGIQQFVLSAKFRDAAFGGDPVLLSTRQEVRFKDERIEILINAPSKDTSLRAARAYADTLVALAPTVQEEHSAEVKVLDLPFAREL